MRNHVSSAFVMLMCGACQLLAADALAQVGAVSVQEYIESTSPLGDGRSVTSRSSPGDKVQTVTSIANLPGSGRTQPSQADANGLRTASSSAARNTYPYPASTPPATTTNFGARALAQGNAQANPQTAQANYRQSAYQVPTLGLGPVGTRTAQNCNCAPAPPQNFQPQNFQAQGFPPAASQAPSLGAAPNINIQVPGQINNGFTQPGFQQPTQVYQPNYQFQPGVGTPQFGGGSGTGSSWLTPFVTGRGQYTPLISFRNMPPGTHLGQGIIGQPTAYVDGQPIRNLLRYVAP